MRNKTVISLALSAAFLAGCSKSDQPAPEGAPQAASASATSSLESRIAGVKSPTLKAALQGLAATTATPPEGKKADREITSGAVKVWSQYAVALASKNVNPGDKAVTIDVLTAAKNSAAAGPMSQTQIGGFIEKIQNDEPIKSLPKVEPR